MPHFPEHVTFINQAIRVEGGGSGDPWQTGWYKKLFFDPVAGIELDPTIADVHTDPGGDTPFLRDASVLHVGTGLPRPSSASTPARGRAPMPASSSLTTSSSSPGFDA